MSGKKHSSLIVCFVSKEVKKFFKLMKPVNVANLLFFFVADKARAFLPRQIFLNSLQYKGKAWGLSVEGCTVRWPERFGAYL